MVHTDENEGLDDDGSLDDDGFYRCCGEERGSSHADGCRNWEPSCCLRCGTPYASGCPGTCRGDGDMIDEYMQAYWKEHGY